MFARDPRSFTMKRTVTILAAGALFALPTSAFSAPGNSQGSTNGTGWDHLNGPTTTGQPGAECGDEGALTRPGQSENAPGSAFNPDGKAGTVYAGEQDQNSRNTASVSQYDAACLDHTR
jgi:hypothetical protein